MTGAPHLSITCCLALNILFYACSGFNLATISEVFTVAFLLVLLLVRAKGEASMRVLILDPWLHVYSLC